MPICDLRSGSPGGDGLFVYENLLGNVVEREFLFRELLYHFDVVGVGCDREVLYRLPRVHLFYEPCLCGGFIRRLEFRRLGFEFGFEGCGHFLGEYGDCGKASEYK